jgi:serine protease Do
MTLRDLNPSLSERLDLPRGMRGVLVMEVEPGEAAEDAGLTARDVIVSVNGEAVATVDGFDRAIEAARPVGRARLRVYNAQIGGGSYRVAVLRLK